MIEFARLWVFAALPVPLLAWYALAPQPQRRALRIPAGLAAMLKGLPTNRRASSFGRATRLLVPALGWVAIICAIAGPQTRLGNVLVSNARDVLVAVDLSASMATRDVTVSGDQSAQTDDAAPVERLTLMRDLVGQFIKGRSGDRVALIGFATEAYLIVPLTYDVAAAAQMLTELNIGLPGRRTDIGRAIGLAVQSLKDEPERPRILAILSDGQTNAGGLSALDAAGLAADIGIEIHMIGFGAEIAPENVAHMREISDRTGGAYQGASTARELELAYASINARLPPRAEDRQAYLLRDLSWIPTVFALGLVCWIGWREVRSG